MDRIEPQNVKGFRDLRPREAYRKNEIISTIRRVYESYGFLPLETPGLEYLDILLGEYGEENTKQIFRFKSPEEQQIALRFDLTVPLARVVAQYNDLPKPFKRYQVGSVWRADKPDPGRFREFTQFDVDVVGASSQLAEAEVISAVVKSLQEIGVWDFTVRVNSRRALDAMMEKAGIPPEKQKDVLRILDKLYKIGIINVQAELTDGRIDASGDHIEGIGLGELKSQLVIGYFQITNDKLKFGRTERKKVLEFMTENFGEGSCSDLRDLDTYLNILGLDSETVAFDPTIARGLDYYTGPVFEVNLNEKPQFGSVAGGGRYDSLVRRFTGVDLPAVGFSIGIDRLLTAIGDENDYIDSVDVVVTIMERERLDEYLRMADELRANGVRVDLYLGDDKSLRKQLQYADKVNARLSLIVGSNEFERGVVTVKRLRSVPTLGRQIADRTEWLKKSREKQLEIPRKDLGTEIKRLLSEGPLLITLE